VSHDVIAVVGATGAVGREALSILAAKGIAASRIRAFASERSAGVEVDYLDRSLRVEPLSTERLQDCSAALFCSSAEVARVWVPVALRAGLKVIDNSSAFRLDPAVPLVVADLEATVDGDMAANPNCSTILLTSVIAPLERALGLKHVTVSTYQAVSGAGIAAIEELRRQSRDVLEGRVPQAEVFPDPCAFNVFPHESPLDGNDGSNGEERKIVAETRRILSRPDLAVFPTCCRVPVERAHSQAIVVETRTRPDPRVVIDTLRASAGLEILEGKPPTPLRAAGGDRVLVGRIRVDRDSHRVGLWACMDQLRRGAALNAIEVLETMGGLQPGQSPNVRSRSTLLPGSAR
jgi:aspartate-semialdehyde dehydrogenase